MAGEDQGPILIWNTCVFGSLAILLVALRLGFRGYRRRLDLSDYCIFIALVSILSPGCSYLANKCLSYALLHKNAST